MDERLIKGKEIPVNAEDFEYEATGNADGVVYLDEKRTKQFVKDSAGNEILNVKVVLEGKERQALSYLKPASSEWKKLNPGMQGYSRPDIHHILPKEAKAEAASLGVALKWILNAEHPKAINAQEFPNNWTFHKVEPGVWAILWVD